MKNKKFLSRQMFRGVHWDDVFIFEREQTMDHNRFGGPNQIYPLPPNKKFPPKPSSFKIRSQQTSDLLKKLSEHAILEPMPIRIQTQNNIEKPVIIGNPSDRAGSGRPKKANRKKDILKNGAWHRQHAREQSRKNAINLGGTNFDQETSSIAGRTFTAVDDPKVDEGDSVNDQWLDYQDRLSKRYYDLCDLIKRLLLSESVSKLEFVMQKLNDTITSKKSASSAKVSPQHHNNKHYTGHKQHYNHQALNQPPSKPSSNYNRYQAPLPAHSQ
uniref:Uncharacterized protein n=1 Tax=Strigamia maritima TaxID=126957 RepID=T1ITC6_STRMM